MVKKDLYRLKVKELREAVPLSQAALAKLLRVSQSAIAMIENGSRPGDKPEFVARLELALGARQGELAQLLFRGVVAPIEWAEIVGVVGTGPARVDTNLPAGTEITLGRSKQSLRVDVAHVTDKHPPLVFAAVHKSFGEESTIEAEFADGTYLRIIIQMITRPKTDAPDAWLMRKRETDSILFWLGDCEDLKHTVWSHPPHVVTDDKG
jgi:transcriptional regulator with XRE-family HTH domain